MAPVEVGSTVLYVCKPGLAVVHVVRSAPALNVQLLGLALHCHSSCRTMVCSSVFLQARVRCLVRVVCVLHLQPAT